MSEINNGGPAFPQKEPLSNDWHGMSLRDYFAAQALQGILVGRALLPDQWAKEAYAMADAMLKAREGK